jgi:hypothetical protein
MPREVRGPIDDRLKFVERLLEAEKRRGCAGDSNLAQDWL